MSISANLKHAYFGISLHPDDRHVFAFAIQRKGQLQPTRTPQGSQSAGFAVNEFVHRVFGALSEGPCEPSLLESDTPDRLPTLTFYVDDFFGGFPDVKSQFQFLHDHFLPRVAWAKVRLAFKKLKIFEEEIVALGVSYHVGGFMRIIPDRVKKIMDFPTPTSALEVKSFLG